MSPMPSPLIFLLLLFAVSTPSNVAAQTRVYVGEVIELDDGDSFTIRERDRTRRIRLCGIDAPEYGRSGYHEASAALSKLILNQTIRCIQVSRGGETPCDGRSRPKSHDRFVAQCFLGDKDIAMEMVRAGHACHWRKYDAGYYKVNETTCVRE